MLEGERRKRVRIKTLNWENGGRATVVSQEGNWVSVSLPDPERLTMWLSQLLQGAFTII
jgi:hypothetical protein